MRPGLLIQAANLVCFIMGEGCSQKLQYLEVPQPRIGGL